jgi:hypothetical protein
MQTNANQNAPSGAKLLDTLIKLLAEQEGVKITYEKEKRKNENGKVR